MVGAIAAVTELPATKGPSKRAPNQRPNCSESLIARHTRSSGARSSTRFSIRSVLICNLLVAFQHITGRPNTQPFDCLSDAVRLLPEGFAALPCHPPPGPAPPPPPP